jgi:phosphohistidine phosphatase
VKLLHLLRHAKSSWDDPELPDHQRPLAPRGRRACETVAEHIRREGIAPQLVFCSPARRARETLERIADGLPERIELRIKPELYGASARELADVLRDLSDTFESVMVVAHNPGIQQLAIALAAPGEQAEAVVGKFPTAALATLAFDTRWRALAPGIAEFVAFVTPKELRHAGD